MGRNKKAFARSSERPPRAIDVPQPSIGWLPAILAAGLLIRFFFLHQSRNDVLSTHLVIDAEFYDQWAQRIAHGDWLGKTVFYQDPLYAYFLAVIYKTFGRSLGAVRLVQAALDTASAGLAYLLARRLFNPLTGVLSAAAMALMSPLVYYVGLLDKTTLSVFLIAAALALIAEAVASGSLLLYAAAGAAFGTAALARGNMLVVAAVVAPWLLANRQIGESFLPRLKKCFCFCLAVASIVGAVAFRNYRVGHDLVLITANPGLNFFIGNNPYTVGQYIEPPFIQGIPEHEYDDAHSAAEQFTGRKLDKASEVSRYWMGQGIKFIVENPKKWLVLSARKMFLAFHGFEIAETYSYDYFRDKYWSLAIPFLSFGIIAPLGLLGAARSLFKQRPNALHVFLAAYLLSLLAFFVTSRYRTPLLVGLIPFAASLLVDLWHSPKTPKTALPVVLALGAFFAASHWRPPWFVERVVDPTLSTAHMVAGYIELESGDIDKSVTELAAATKANPRAGTAYAYLGEAYYSRGDMRSALVNYQQALRHNPELDQVWENAGLIFLKKKDYRQASLAFANACKLRPNEPKYRQSLDLAARLLKGDRSSQRGPRQ
ncbi:MAG: glycosyltransferase family 39 protein [Elusimicrobiota bacterium]